MGINFKSAECPRDRGLALESGKDQFKCRLCGHVFKESKAKANKYKAKKSAMENVSPEIKKATFDSNLERRFLLQYLMIRLKAGEISNVRWKPRVEVDTDIHYTPEVTYRDTQLKMEITVDTKGSATKGGRFPVICKLWRNHMDHPLHIVEQHPRTKKWITTKKILPRNSEGILHAPHANP